MKKTIVKNLLILSLAVGALVVIGNNVFANDADPFDRLPTEEEEEARAQCPGGDPECKRIVKGNTVHIFYKR